jgi:hypothetical protein
MATERLTFKDEDGNWVAEAERGEERHPLGVRVWSIRFEDGEEQFHGARTAVVKKVLARVPGAKMEATP